MIAGIADCQIGNDPDSVLAINALGSCIALGAADRAVALGKVPSAIVAALRSGRP